MSEVLSHLVHVQDNFGLGRSVICAFVKNETSDNNIQDLGVLLKEKQIVQPETGERSAIRPENLSLNENMLLVHSE